MECGTPQSLACPTCTAPVTPGQKFCMECGTALAASSGPNGTGGHPERRLVTVLFADLVSFTTLSEHRDPETVRDMLERYFERCRTIIGRYGGTVEKFIGDAVMAVWGTPVAREDDAERAVRAALELAGAVTALGAGDRHARPARPRGPADGGDGGQRRRRARGHGHRRRRQHGVPDPVAGPAGNRVRRRRDPARDGARDRLRGRRRACRQGPRPARPGVAGAARHRRHRRHGPRQRARGAVRRPSGGAPGGHRRRRSRPQRPPRRARHRRRRRRDGQVAPVVGVREARRRDRGRHLLAPRPLHLLRRGRLLLGARRDRACPRRHRRERAGRAGTREAARDRRALRDRRARAAPGAPRGSSTCSAWPTAPRTPATCSAGGGCSSSASRTPIPS